jgi:predicted regulator of Ras-like GTPase activity (Roadblock/LC7/MglB family)
MSSPFDGMLTTMIRHRGVVGSMVVDEGDGLIVDGELQAGVDGAAVAALAAALHRRARLSAGAAGLGMVTFLQLDAERGHVCVVGREGLLLVVVTDSRAHVGLIRSAMLQQAGALT